ncbi:MAG: 4-hydroxy-tetrahydrodipicolinate reductase [Candidatus Eremiobacteraeota bacterium]|nr:4-hydroxy-tetrahydrodipicolinate reductase [Candidatus Eremiobacteraeota bacterium]
MIRVAVAGALGKMGHVARAALASAQGALEYAGGYARVAVPYERITDDLGELLSRADVLLDLSTRPGSVDISLQAAAQGVRPVIGATGWTDDERAALAATLAERGIGGMLVPNFSIGAVLLMRLAEEAAKYLPSTEIVEMHHAGKKDAPSGTSLLTAERIARVAGKMPAIHSVRLPGLVAHQEVLFGGSGELLTLRHDSFSRESFVPGMFAAIKAVMHARGLVVGLDAVLRE